MLCILKLSLDIWFSRSDIAFVAILADLEVPKKSNRVNYDPITALGYPFATLIIFVFEWFF